MPPPKKLYPVYILTQNGQIEKATYFPALADQWVNLGEAYDYVIVVPDKDTPAEERLPSLRENVTEQQTQIDQTLRDAEKTIKRFQPKSSLLKLPAV
jgi:hypothetical protein